MSKSSRVINLSSPTANMFGIEPCPRCGSVFRWPPVVKSGPPVIQCDDCHLVEPVESATAGKE